MVYKHPCKCNDFLIISPQGRVFRMKTGIAEELETNHLGDVAKVYSFVGINTTISRGVDRVLYFMPSSATLNCSWFLRCKSSEFELWVRIRSM